MLYIILTEKSKFNSLSVHNPSILRQQWEEDKTHIRQPDTSSQEYYYATGIFHVSCFHLLSLQNAIFLRHVRSVVWETQTSYVFTTQNVKFK